MEDKNGKIIPDAPMEGDERIEFHDDDGNLFSDGRWTNTWNAENRLIQMETTTTAVDAGVPRVKLAFSYDYMGRRYEKIAYTDYYSAAYQSTNTITFVYDGWNLISE